MDPLDFLAVDDLLSDDERAIRDSVRAMAAAELAPHVADWYDAGALPRELATVFGDLGLLGMHLQGYGCAGTSAVAYGVACRELEAVDSGLRSFVSVQGSLAMFAIHHWGSEEHRKQWLPNMATGEALGCFGLTESDAGSDPGSMRTRARRDGDDWVLNGTKMWITNGTLADVAVVWAQTDDGIRGFVVPDRLPGLRAPRRSSASCRCARRSPPSSRSRTCGCRQTRPSPRSAASRARSACLNEARFGILWGVVGAARACYAEALEYSTQQRSSSAGRSRPSSSPSASWLTWSSPSATRPWWRCRSVG